MPPTRPLPLRLSFLLVLLLSGGCDMRRSYQAALLMSDIASGEGTSLWKRTTPDPRRESIVFPFGQRQMDGDLYLSPEGARAGLLLVPGAAEEGRNDPRLVALATSLARARFAVLVPDLVSLRQLQVNSGNIDEVTAAFDWLVSRPHLAPEGRAGIMAFSYAAGPAVLAAMHPRLAKRVLFILTVGGYYDLRNVMTFFTTGYFRRGDQWRYLRPNAFGKWVFVRANLGRIENRKDRLLLEMMARRKLDNLNADVETIAAGLSPQGLRLYSFIVNRDPDKAQKLFAQLPETIRDEIEALNPARNHPRRLRAKLLLVHGYEDPIIPYTESIAFDQALPEKQASLYLVKGLIHVDIHPGLLSRWRIWRALDALLAQRE